MVGGWMNTAFGSLQPPYLLFTCCCGLTVFSTADSATSTNWSLPVPTKGRLWVPGFL